jgi:hypothetical protein
MTTPLPAPSSRFTPEQCQILGQVYALILSWRRERKKLEGNGRPNATTSSMSKTTFNPSTQCGVSHE